NAEIDAEAKLARNAGIAPANYVRAPLNSLHELTPQETARVFQMINIMKDPARQPVYVHCAHGADRTGLVVGLYELVTGQKTV
ncbi:tyrosine-protein phosphatase, partial [Acinetobacter baumannii]